MRLFACLMLCTAVAAAAPLGTTFTYQGQLTESGQPANGLYDLQVCLFDTPSTPITLTCMPDLADVPVEAGVFTVPLDFGSNTFSGEQRWLELRVRAGASTGTYTILSPRQLIRAAPEALRAAAASAAPWSGLSGVPASIADGVDNDSGGTLTSITAGGGLSGGTITGSGTIGIATGGVGSAQLAANAVDGSRVLDGSIGTTDLAGNAVDATRLADNAVDTTAVQNLAITQTKIAAGAVGATQLASGAVGAAQIDPAQVQARISGSCAMGEYFRGINVDGSAVCSELVNQTRITVVDDPNNIVGIYTSIAIGSDGLPVIAYQDFSAGTLKVAKCANPACTGAATITTVDPVAGVGGNASIAIGSDGLPVIGYQNGLAGSLKVAKCANAACTGGATITTVEDQANVVGSSIAVAIGGDGLPVIAYNDATAGLLKVAKCANAACFGATAIATVDDPVNSVGTFASIAIGSDGLPVISYYDFSVGNLKVAKCANAACSSTPLANITTVDNSASNVGQHTSIDIGIDGLPVISYYDVTAFALKVAKCADAACTGAAIITTVDDPANRVGQYTSIAVGSDGLPVISYFDEIAAALKIAKCASAACTGAATITTIDDSANQLGSYTSIAIGIDGLPVISYADNFAGTLKVAKCGTRSCQ